MSSSIGVASRREVGAKHWDTYIDSHPSAWFWHRSGWLDYCLAFHDGNLDCSIALVRGGRVAGICPMIFEREGRAIAIAGEGCPMPALDWNIDLPSTFLIMKALGQRLAGRMVFRTAQLGDNSPAIQQAMLQQAALGFRDASFQTQLLSLAPSEAELWRAIRKSYKGLVHHAERKYEIVVDDRGEHFDAYRAVHRASVGVFMPRPALTYDLQAEWLRAGHALLIGARRRDGGSGLAATPGPGEGSTPSASTIADCGPWVAFNYLFLDKRQAYYGSGPGLVPNAMHALHWAAIRVLKAKGIERYELGWHARAGEDAKHQGIAHFKQGWGGFAVPVHAVEWRQ